MAAEKKQLQSLIDESKTLNNHIVCGVDDHIEMTKYEKKLSALVSSTHGAFLNISKKYNYAKAKHDQLLKLIATKEAKLSHFSKRFASLNTKIIQRLECFKTVVKVDKCSAGLLINTSKKGAQWICDVYDIVAKAFLFCIPVHLLKIINEDNLQPHVTSELLFFRGALFQQQADIIEQYVKKAGSFSDDIGQPKVHNIVEADDKKCK